MRLKNGKTLSDLAREHTEEAVKTLVKIMRDDAQPALQPLTKFSTVDGDRHRKPSRSPTTANLLTCQA